MFFRTFEIGLSALTQLSATSANTGPLRSESEHKRIIFRILTDPNPDPAESCVNAETMLQIRNVAQSALKQSVYILNNLRRKAANVVIIG
jgi:hypothetical protein